MSKWPMVPLEKVASPVERPEVPVPGKPYRQVGVRLWGEGAYERELLDGGETKYKTLSRVETDDIVVNKIWARNGSVAVVPGKLAGCYVSGEFPTFKPTAEKLEPRWFHWLTKTPTFWDQCDEKSRGTSGKNRIRPERFLEIAIPLPPLPEQQRIVARIESLAAKIEEARNVRHTASNETQFVLTRQLGQMFDELARHHSTRPFGSYNPHVTSGPRNWAKHYQEGGQRFYRAQDIGPNGEVLPESKVFIEPPSGDQGRSASLQPGDLMLVITGATVGRCSLFREELEPGFVSQHVGICRLPKDSIDPDFALWGLRGPHGQEQLLGQRYGQGKPGLNLSNIRAITLPIPLLPEQHRIVAYLDGLQSKVDALKKLQSETAAELTALLPSILDKAFKGEF